MATPTSYKAESFPLAKGMQGEHVRILQAKLGIEADGKFWTATESALQNAYGVSTCSEELFKRITQSKNSSMETSLSEKTKKIIKYGAITLGVVGVGALAYSIVKGRNNSSPSRSRKAKALNGVRRVKSKAKTKRRRSKKRSRSTKRMMSMKTKMLRLK